jgi:Asp-tRNA(Asn)/Glu-tRNA(Gln) amidotransferase A subunit family amidase
MKEDVHVDLTELPAWQMAVAVRDRQVRAIDLLEAHLDKIKRCNPKLNAFVTVDEQRARLQAKAADDAVSAGRPLGSLQGVPITIKSSIDVAGLLCEAGTRLRTGHVAEADAPLVSRLKGRRRLSSLETPRFRNS